MDCCDCADIPLQPRYLAFPIFLTGLAKDYYKSCHDKDLEDLCAAVCGWFETEKSRFTLLKWESMMLQDVKSFDKTTPACFLQCPH